MIGLFSKKKPYIDIEFTSNGKTKTRVIERPGLWMTPAELNALVTDLKCVQSTLGVGDFDYGVLKGEKNTLDSVVITIIYDLKANKPFAFNALTLMNCTLGGKYVTVVHLGLVIVDSTYRAKGLSWILYGLTTFLLFFKNRFAPLYISNVTQVPSIIGNVSESFGNVFPNPLTGQRRTYEHLVVAREIMSKHRSVFGVCHEAGFDEDTFVISDSYRGGSDNLKKTFEQTAKHRNPIYNNFCKDLLNYRRGDDFLQIGQMDMKTYYNYMLHSATKSGFIEVFYKVVFSCLDSLLVPAFQWLSVNRSMGILRSRRND